MGSSRSPGNPGIRLDLRWLDGVRVEGEAIETAVASLHPATDRPSLLRVARALDLTTLSGDDTPERVRALCARAARPLADEPEVRCAAVCVYPALVPTAIEALEGSPVRVATVAAGFPAGLTPLPLRIEEVRAARALGAAEIDVVIRRSWVLEGAWPALHEEIRSFREAAENACLKVILATGELGELENVARASLVAMMAGADFIKTSTGKEEVNATLEAGAVMVRCIRQYEERVGARVGLKPAGGIRTAGEGLRWLALVEEELGAERTEPAFFRIGASSLLADVQRELDGL